MLTRCVTFIFDCQTRKPKQSVGNCERQCADPWMQPNGRESMTLNFWRLEDFPRAWHLRAIFSTKTWRRTFWCTAMIFHSGPTGGAKACTEFAARCIRAEQCCDSGPRVVTVTDSEFLWQNIDVATVENRIRARPAACFPRSEGSGTDQCQGTTSSGRDQRGR